jgi:rhodanese-related sulfurtransferase
MRCYRTGQKSARNCSRLADNWRRLPIPRGAALLYRIVHGSRTSQLGSGESQSAAVTCARRVKKGKPVMPHSTPTIVIIGGVAGGASAATCARRMNEDAEIILLERDEHVSFANCGLGELDPTLPTVVSCGMGLRGHVATRILRQHGFTRVWNLSGGATVRNRMVKR